MSDENSVVFDCEHDLLKTAIVTLEPTFGSQRPKISIELHFSPKAEKELSNALRNLHSKNDGRFGLRFDLTQQTKDELNGFGRATLTDIPCLDHAVVLMDDPDWNKDITDQSLVDGCYDEGARAAFANVALQFLCSAFNELQRSDFTPQTAR